MSAGIRAVVAASLLLLGSSVAQAATVTVNGANVSFTYDDATLFGAGLVIGDNIFFTPTNFDAISNNTDGVVIVNDTLNIDVEIFNPSAFSFDDIMLLERGDYRLIGNSSSVDVGGQLRVRDITFNPLNEMTDFITETAPLTNNDGNFHNWEADAVVNFVSGGVWDGVSKVRVTIENVLTATSTELGDSAFIEKKFASNTVGLMVNPVPIPAAGWLFGSGLLGLIGVGRQRRKK